MTRRVLYHCAATGAHSSRLYVSAFNLSLNISSRDPGSRRSVGSRNNIKATHEQASVWRRNIGSDDNIPKETSSNARHQSQMQDTNLKRLSIKFAVDRRSATDTVWDCRSESYKPFLSSKASTIIYASGTVINKFYVHLFSQSLPLFQNRTKPGVNGRWSHDLLITSRVLDRCATTAASLTVFITVLSGSSFNIRVCLTFF